MMRRLLLLLLFVAVNSATRLDAPTGAMPSGCGQACHTDADCAGTCNTCIAGYCNQTVFVWNCYSGVPNGDPPVLFAPMLLRPAYNITVGTTTCAKVRLISVFMLSNVSRSLPLRCLVEEVPVRSYSFVKASKKLRLLP